jgi:hypothetical protein
MNYISVRWIIDLDNSSAFRQFLRIVVNKGGETRLLRTSYKDIQGYLSDVFGIKLSDQLSLQQLIEIADYNSGFVDWKIIDESEFLDGSLWYPDDDIPVGYWFDATNINKGSKIELPMEYDISIDSLELDDETQDWCRRRGWVSIGDALEVTQRLGKKGMIEIAGTKIYKKIIAALVEKRYLKKNDLME